MSGPSRSARTADPHSFVAVPRGACELVVGGDVDASTAPELRDALLDRRIERVHLAAVTFMGAAGLSALLHAHRERPGGLVLGAPSRCVVRALELVGHEDSFSVSGP